MCELEASDSRMPEEAPAEAEEAALGPEITINAIVSARTSDYRQTDQIIL